MPRLGQPCKVRNKHILNNFSLVTLITATVPTIVSMTRINWRDHDWPNRCDEYTIPCKKDGKNMKWRDILYSDSHDLWDSVMKNYILYQINNASYKCIQVWRLLIII